MCGIEYLWTGCTVSPFPVHEGIRAKVDDHAELEILPLHLLGRRFDLGKTLGGSIWNEDQQDKDQQNEAQQPQGHYCKHSTGARSAHEYPVSQLASAKSIARHAISAER